MDYKVIMVDDDKMVLFLHKILVEGSDLPSGPLTFQNGQEALDFIEQEKDLNCFYFILLDLNMPIMDGWEFLNNLQQREGLKEKILVSVVTSSINSEDRRKALEFPTVLDYVEKPLNYQVCNELNQRAIDVFLKRKN